MKAGAREAGRKALRGRALLALALGLALALTGCENLRGWSYRTEQRVPGPPLVDKTVVVLPFEDRRPADNVNALDLFMIPLLPYGWADYDTPEAMQRHVSSGRGAWSFRPVDDITRAIASELDNAGIFREVFPGERKEEGDLVFKGEILSTAYRGRIYSYCLGAYGPVLWALGLPAASVSNELAIRLTLMRPSGGAPVWSREIRERKAVRMSVYRTQPDFYYDELLKAGMKEALPDLFAAMTRSPAIR